jgi:hypothetical protein
MKIGVLSTAVVKNEKMSILGSPFTLPERIAWRPPPPEHAALGRQWLADG